MRRLAFLFVALVALASATSALTITHSPLPPSGSDVALALDVVGDQGGHPLEHGTGMSIDVGQTFRLAQPLTLDRVTFKVRAVTEIAGELMTVWIGTYSDGDDSSRNELLRVEYAALPADLPVDQVRYLTFDLDYGVALEPNRQYGVVIGFTGGGHVKDARAEVLHLGGDVYGDGTAVSEFGAFTDTLAEDLVFFLQGGSEPPPVPPTPDPDELLWLRQSRFQVEAYWRTPLGTEGFAQPVPLTDETGAFWFFAAGNLELFLKVLDACDSFDRYWVFVAGLTDVEVQIVVRDLEGGAARTYFNPMGQPFQPILDASAFTTCP